MSELMALVASCEPEGGFQRIPHYWLTPKHVIPNLHHEMELSGPRLILNRLP